MQTKTSKSFAINFNSQTRSYKCNCKQVTAPIKMNNGTLYKNISSLRYTYVQSLLMPFTPSPLYIAERSTSVEDIAFRSYPICSSSSPFRHIAHLLVQSILKQSWARSFASVNSSRKRKNVRRWLIDCRSLDLRRSGVRSDRWDSRTNTAYERESIIVQVTSRRNVEGYLWKRIMWIMREPHGKTMKNVVIGDNDNDDVDIDNDDDNMDDDSR